MYNRGKLSGPLLDRIDLHVEVPALPDTDILQTAQGEPSAAVRERVVAARARQRSRQGKPNAALSVSEVETHCLPDEEGESLLRHAINHLNMTARAYHRVLKVARSIADLATAPTVKAAHIAEAIRYRRQA